MKKYLYFLFSLSLFSSCQSTTERMEGFAVHGIDVSHHQTVINWDTVAIQAIDFAFIKATEGRDFQDSCFVYNWMELQRVGIKRGAYHFFHPTLSAERQAFNFIRTVDLNYGDLPPVLDFEVSNGVNEQAILKGLQTWLDLIERHYKIRPIIYTNQKLYYRYLLNNFKNYPIWMARYNTVQPEMLSDRDWHFWQYGNRGNIKGIEGPVDLNVFNGSLLELETLSLSVEAAISSLE